MKNRHKIGLNPDTEISALQSNDYKMTGNVEVNMPKQTGTFMFQFDDDEPIPISTVMDYGKVTLELTSRKRHTGSDGAVSFDTGGYAITFKSENYEKKFKLFIKEHIENESNP